MAASRHAKLAAILAAIVASLFYVAIGSSIRPARDHDFMNLYTGGMLARTGHLADLYDFDVQIQRQDQIAPGISAHFPFVRPPFYALILSPISLLPFQAAFGVWIAIQVGLFLCVWAWAWRRFGHDSIIYCSLFLPAAVGIAHGQDCVVLSIVGLGVLEATERRKDSLAGALSALLLAKFHLFLLVPFAIAARRRWRMLAWYLGIAATLGLGSIALVGPEGARRYIALLTRKDLATLSPSPERMLGVRSIALNFGGGIWLEACLAIGVVALALWAAWRVPDDESGQDWRWISAAILASLLLSPHTYEYDAAVLLAFVLAAVHLGKTSWVRGCRRHRADPAPLSRDTGRIALGGNSVPRALRAPAGSGGSSIVPLNVGGPTESLHPHDVVEGVIELRGDVRTSIATLTSYLDRVSY